MPPNENVALVRRFFAALDLEHAAALAELVATDFSAHLAGRPSLGIQEFARAIDALYTAFPDLQHVIEHAFGEGDSVAVRLTERGTHGGTFQGLAPTGRRIAMPAIVVVTVKHGAIAELWMQVDALGRLQQLGIAPSVP